MCEDDEERHREGEDDEERESEKEDVDREREDRWQRDILWGSIS